MTKLKQWSIEAVRYGYDLSNSESAELGAKKIRQEIYNLVKSMHEINEENLRLNPHLTSTLLLELAEKIKTIGDENV